MPYRLRIADRNLEAEIIGRRPKLRVSIDGVAHTVDADPEIDGEIEVVIDGVRYRGWRCRVKNGWHVRFNGHTFVVRFEEGIAAARSASAQEEIRADMPGVVVALHCEPGQLVKAGDQLLTIESMKLQVTLVTSHDARVERIHVTPNSVFERGALLVSFARSENELP